MASPNYAQEFFGAVGNILKSLPSNLTEDELKAIGPDLQSFLTWVEQNPSEVLNPAVSGPKLLVLKAQVLAAQSTACEGSPITAFVCASTRPTGVLISGCPTALLTRA